MDTTSLPQTIYIDDTWGAGTSSMTWGGSYSGRAMYGVTVIKLAAGDGTAIPEPATLSLFGLAVAAGAVIRRRRGRIVPAEHFESEKGPVAARRRPFFLCPLARSA